MSNLRIIGLIIGMLGLFLTLKIYRGAKWKRLNFVLFGLFSISIIAVSLYPDMLNTIAGILALHPEQRGRILTLLILSNILLWFLLLAFKTKIDKYAYQFDLLIRNLGYEESSHILENKMVNKEIAVIIPAFNEVESLKEVLKRMPEEVEGRKLIIVVIDDGSTDNSPYILTDISNKDSTVSVIKFRKNYGQTAAFAAGFKFSRGDVVITMDADLQNDPEDIPQLLEKMSEGYDLVSGWRRDRKDKTLSRKFPSFFANRIINKLIEGTQVKIHDFGCSLKAYKKGVVKNIKIYGEMHRFIPAYAAWLGIKVAEIPVKHHPRRYGQAKYGLERVGRVILDLITLRFFTGFKTRPLQFFGKIAMFVTAVGSVISFVLLVLGYLTAWGIDFQTFILMVMFSIMGGFQFIIVGLLSEIMMRGFLESQNQDEYVVEMIYNKQIPDK
ncbi:MAG: DUF2304 family protein [Calditrichia bacterium]|nr:DUF2304 family protein [Calditrichia bacterium]